MPNYTAFEILISLLLMLLVGLVAAGYRAFALPRLRPERFDPRLHRQGPVVVCLGDSLTHGSVSYNYLKLLKQALAPRTLTLVNGGVNGDLAYNLRQRLQAVAKCQPDFVTVLIGTNDVVASLSDANNQFYIGYKKLPQAPDLDWYRHNLDAILTWLKTHTQARIGVYSLPVLGEQLDHAVHQRLRDYNNAIRELAEHHGVNYLPLHEQHSHHLARFPGQPREDFVSTNHPSVYSAMAERHLLLRSYGQIGRQRGYRWTCEGVHMNKQGAQVIARLALDFIQTTTAPHAQSAEPRPSPSQPSAQQTNA